MSVPAECFPWSNSIQRLPEAGFAATLAGDLPTDGGVRPTGRC